MTGLLFNYLAKLSICVYMTGLLRTPMTNIRIQCEDVTQQTDGSLCGVMAVAFMTDTLFGLDPRHREYTLSHMRGHLADCLANKMLAPFPSQDRRISKRLLSAKSFKVYCICRMPFREQDLDDIKNRMGECSVPRCKRWFHRGCVMFPPEMFDPILGDMCYWECPRCK